MRMLGRTAVSAGGSAVEEARSAAAAAGVLERKAAYARQRAENFGKGAEGERLVAQALAPLTTCGGFVLHDRAVAHGSNIDHLVIGPGGVTVLDAKHWVSPVSVRDELRVGGRPAIRTVEHLADLTAQVRASMVEARIELPVMGMLVFTHDSNAFMPRQRLRDVDLVGLHHLLPTLARTGSATRVHVEAAVRHLSGAFPPYGAEVPHPSGPVATTSSLYARANFSLFVEPWARAGRQRLYVSDDRGRDLGYQDLVSGVVAITEPDSDAVVRGLLAHAAGSRLGLTASAFPKVPFELGGNRLISRLSRSWITYHVGSHWRRGPLDRLYGTRVSHGEGVHDLGYVDLATGFVCPVSEHPLAKELSPPRRYLERLAEAYAASKRARVS
ncbi:nuclease-related domain-containing protein [Lapillicoccus sp.]|uniref:nuclease-related domain-containing protein n=1 Tax=Lapillicoccus sp. TaxID=1909287 RepID=UPI0025D392F3|nr:nuclease-related domain-containing protein [Lapillicoccus sp.]